MKIKQDRKEIELILEDRISKAEEIKLDRSAFIYMNPSGKDQANFAQCKTCMMWTGSKGQTCTSHGKMKIKGSASCAIYVPGPTHADMSGKEMKVVTPEVSGLVDAAVRCENCSWFSSDKCQLFQRLNEELPGVWNLDIKVKAKGCCNAWEPK